MIAFPNKKYNIIYADPPWQFNSRIHQENRGFTHSLEDHYDTMKDKDIKDLPVQDIADDDCILFMWVVDSHLKEGIEVIESWGFTYRTIGFTWVKEYPNTFPPQICFNFSPYLLKSTEICLIGMKGKLKNIKDRDDVKGLCFEARTKHSEKPHEIRRRIETMCKDLPKIELFARKNFDAWDASGNEV